MNNSDCLSDLDSGGLFHIFEWSTMITLNAQTHTHAEVMVSSDVESVLDDARRAFLIGARGSFALFGSDQVFRDRDAAAAAVETEILSSSVRRQNRPSGDAAAVDSGSDSDSDGESVGDEVGTSDPVSCAVEASSASSSASLVNSAGVSADSSANSAPGSNTSAAASASASDVDANATDAAVASMQHVGVDAISGCYLLRSPLAALSERERVCETLWRKVFRLVFVRI
jgi:hypothetical protein